MRQFCNFQQIGHNAGSKNGKSFRPSKMSQTFPACSGKNLLKYQKAGVSSRVREKDKKERRGSEALRVNAMAV